MRKSATPNDPFVVDYGPDDWNEHAEDMADSFVVEKPVKKPTENPVEKVKRIPKATMEQFTKYFTSTELQPYQSHLDHFRKTKPRILRVAKKDLAKTIAHHIQQHRIEGVPLIEVNPGAGYLSQELLLHGERNLKLMERDAYFESHLQVSTCRIYDIQNNEINN